MNNEQRAQELQRLIQVDVVARLAADIEFDSATSSSQF